MRTLILYSFLLLLYSEAGLGELKKETAASISEDTLKKYYAEVVQGPDESEAAAKCSQFVFAERNRNKDREAQLGVASSVGKDFA